MQEALPSISVATGGPAPLALGPYDDTPVHVWMSSGPDVTLEAAYMAEGLDAETAGRVRQAVARYEVTWDVRRDPDPLPETADLVADVARWLAARTNGVALVGGHSLLPETGSAMDALFPE